MTNITNTVYHLDGNTYEKEDVINLYRLQKQLLIEENFVADLLECINIWGGYSNDLAASWLFFPKKDEDILKEIKSSDFFTTFEDYAK